MEVLEKRQKETSTEKRKKTDTVRVEIPITRPANMEEINTPVAGKRKRADVGKKKSQMSQMLRDGVFIERS